MTIPKGLISSALYLIFSLSSTPGYGQTAHHLTDVKRICVESLGKTKGSEQLRRDLISQLQKSKLVTIVSSPQNADAVLTGNAELWIRGYYSLNPRSGISPQNGTPMYGGSLSVELAGSNQETLWSYLVTPRFGSTDVAKDLCKELVKEFSQALEDAGQQASDSAHH